MTWQRLSNQSPVEPAAVVEAPTLKEALRLVRQKYGDEVRVIRSRTVTRRQPGGLGQKKAVEVLVQPGTGSGKGAMLERPVSVPTSGSQRLAKEIAAEIERIEKLVRNIAAQQTTCGGLRLCRDNPVAEALVKAGADPGVVVRLCERCQAETGAGPRDHQALLTYLRHNLATVQGTWQDMTGMHVFLGPPGSGRSDMVYGLAATLIELQQKVLVLSLLPRHTGEIRRLQAVAADVGFDAAVIQKAKQLGPATEHLQEYDVVLLDALAFGTDDGQEDADLRSTIIQHPSYHRHLVFPLDRDLLDSQEIITFARQWNCDWLALSRVDQTRRRGKLLNLLDQLPLPVSLINTATRRLGTPSLASPDRLVDLMLNAVHCQSAGGD